MDGPGINVSRIVLCGYVSPLPWFCKLSDSLYSVVDIDVETFSFVIDVAEYNFAITVEGNSIRFEVNFLNNEFCYLHC